MDTKIMTAIFVLAVMVGGIGVATASPADVVGFDTPSERAWAWSVPLEARLAAVDSITGGQYFVGSSIAYKEFWYNYYSVKLVKYTTMYNRLYDADLTDGPTHVFKIEQGNSTGNSSA